MAQAALLWMVKMTSWHNLKKLRAQCSELPKNLLIYICVEVGEKPVTEKEYLSLAAGTDFFKSISDIYFYLCSTDKLHL